METIRFSLFARKCLLNLPFYALACLNMLNLILAHLTKILRLVQFHHRSLLIFLFPHSSRFRSLLNYPWRRVIIIITPLIHRRFITFSSLLYYWRILRSGGNRDDLMHLFRFSLVIIAGSAWLSEWSEATWIGAQLRCGGWISTTESSPSPSIVVIDVLVAFFCGGIVDDLMWASHYLLCTLQRYVITALSYRIGILVERISDSIRSENIISVCALKSLDSYCCLAIQFRFLWQLLVLHRLITNYLSKIRLWCMLIVNNKHLLGSEYPSILGDLVLLRYLHIRRDLLCQFSWDLLLLILKMTTANKSSICICSNMTAFIDIASNWEASWLCEVLLLLLILLLLVRLSCIWDATAAVVSLVVNIGLGMSVICQILLLLLLLLMQLRIHHLARLLLGM